MGDTYRLEVDSSWINDLNFILDSLLRTPEYKRTVPEHLEDDLLIAFLEHKLEGEWYAADSFHTALMNNTQIEEVEQAIPLFESFIKADPNQYPELARSLQFVKERLNDIPEQAYFENLVLGRISRQLQFTIGFDHSFD